MESGRLPRRLAAVLYADIAGYSHATGMDEDGTHESLRGHLDTVTAIVERHQGRVMHFAGDAVLATFAAAVDALDSATAIHRDVAARNEKLPVQSRIQFRIGVNLGDVIEDRGDVYGNGVNVAARLAAIAPPGGTCTSDSVRVAVGQRLPLDYRDLGLQNLKNIVEPVRAFHVTPGAGNSIAGKSARAKRVAPWAALAIAVLIVGFFSATRWGNDVLGPVFASDDAIVGTAPAQPSIAVLPFDNLSAQDDEYFSDGLTEELIQRLWRVPSLKVAPPASSFYFKGKNELPTTIADKLGVRYLLDGSVSLTDERLRVRVQLSDSQNGEVVWGDSFDHERAEVFEIQDTIALAVVEKLELALLAETRSNLTRHVTESAEAQDLYFRAKYLGQRADLPSLDTAVDYYERTFAIDPDYAAAYVGLADTLMRRAQFAELSPQDVTARARELLFRSLTIEPSAPAHAILAFVAHTDFDCEGARKELAAAEKLDSNNVDMLIHTSRHYFACDREPDQSLAYAQRAADVDRLNPWAVFHITQAYWHQFDYEAALRETDLLAERFPDYWLAVWSRWWILSDLERHEEALAVAETVMLLNSYNETKTCLAVSLARLGRIAEAQAIYDELADGGTYWAPAMRALLLVALGKHDAALDALEQAFDTRDTTLIGTLHTKSLLPLHESSRFWSLVDKLKQRPQVEALRKALGVA